MSESEVERQLDALELERQPDPERQLDALERERQLELVFAKALFAEVYA